MKSLFLSRIITSVTIAASLAALRCAAQPGVSPYYKGPDIYSGKTFIIPAGTTFEGRIDTTIGSSISKQGSPFTINIVSPVLANGSDVLIPAGATVLGEVVMAVPANKVPHAKKEKPVGKLRVQINALKMPSGMTYPMVASLTGEDTVGSSTDFLASRFGSSSGPPVRGSGVAYVGTPTGFKSVAPGNAHYNMQTGISQVATKSDMMNDPVMGRDKSMNGRTAISSLVKQKNRNLFIYSGSPLTIRLEAPFKLSMETSGAEESGLLGRHTELHPENAPPANTNNTVNSPAQIQTQTPETKKQPLSVPPTQRVNSQDSNF